MIVHDRKGSETETFPIEIHAPSEECSCLTKRKQNLIKTQDWGQGDEAYGTPGMLGRHRTSPESSAHNLPEKKEKGEGEASQETGRHKDPWKCGHKMCMTWVNNFSLYLGQ